MNLHEAKVEAELQHMIATEQGDTYRATLIRHEWDMLTYARARRARRGWLTALAVSLTLWAAAIAIPVYLITQAVR